MERSIKYRFREAKFPYIKTYEQVEKNYLDDFDYQKYENLLNRQIQVFNYNSKKDFNKFGTRLFRNILRGYFIKGDTRFLKVIANP